ncbi:MAG TPA: DUF1987 domain-containing protein [Cytophagaceae bacterium]|jgi:hypothetical protein|nr:DUF1987 domain-containing protein [Cytophagaceae bacterium]
MELLEIPIKDPRSMGVKFSPQGALTLHGVSCDEDPKPLYQKLKDWVKGYKDKPAEKTEFFIRLKYFNTSSARCILELIQELTPLSKTGKSLVVTWYYENGDEDMLETIRAFEELINHKIEPVVIESYSRG